MARISIAFAVVLAVASVAYAETWTTKSIEQRWKQADDAVDIGDAWSVGVTKFAAALGSPNATSKNPTQLGWFIVIGDACHVIQLVGDDEFVKATSYKMLMKEADEYKDCMRLSKLRSDVPKVKPPLTVDVAAPAREVMKRWAAGQHKKIFDDAHPELRESIVSEAGIAHLVDLFTRAAGKFVKLGTPLEQVVRDFGWTVSVPAIFEKGTLKLTMSFRLVEDKLRLKTITLILPKELQIKPDPAGAATVGRKALDLLLANKLTEFYALADFDLTGMLAKAPNISADIKSVLKELGKVRSIKLAAQVECDGRQCLTFEIQSAGGVAKATFTVVFAVSRWELHEFNLDRPTK